MKICTSLESQCLFEERASFLAPGERGRRGAEGGGSTMRGSLKPRHRHWNELRTLNKEYIEKRGGVGLGVFEE